MTTAIQKFTPAPTLTANERNVVISSNGKKIREISDKQFESGLTVEMQTAYSLLGQNFDKQKHSLIIAGIIEDVKARYSHFAFDDIKMILYFGVRGEFGDVVTINVKVFNQWMKAYSEGLRKEAIAKQREYDQNLLYERFFGEPDAEKRAKIREEWLSTLIAQYDLYRETGVYKVIDYGNKYFNFLKNCGLINFADNIRNEILEEAKKKAAIQHREAKTGLPMNLKDDGAVSFAINEFLGSANAELAIQAIAKQIGLKRYLTNCREMDIDLKQEIIDAFNE